jgi:hypothetical protein
MESRTPKESRKSTNTNRITSVFELISSIEALAKYNARAPLNTEEHLTLFLKSWWSKTYNRPLKDPLLDSYSLEELLYEFFDKIERAKAAEEQIEQQNDKIEEKKEQEVLDWAAQEEQKELEELKAKSALKMNPAEAEENKKWMEEQLRIQKEMFGEDFGDDINFEG